MMTMKSFFMNEIYELKMKCHYYDHCLTETKLKELENGHTINVLEVKLVFLEKKPQIYVRSLKINKKKLLLQTNNSLFKSIRDLSLLFIQDSSSTERKKSTGIHEINRKKLIQQKNQNRTRPQIIQIPTRCKQKMVSS